MVKIHPASVVNPKAEIAEGVQIGPFCYIEEDVFIGAGTLIDSHVSIRRGTRIGERNYLAHGCVFGGSPQDVKYQGEVSYLEIGDQNIFREYITLHRGSGPEAKTVVGSGCFLMAYCHLGHNCRVGNYVTMANTVGVSGYCVIEDYANIGGMSGIHQYVKIGRMAMIGGGTMVRRDVPPYTLVQGNDQELYGINYVGLKRLGVSSENRSALKKAYRLMFKSGLSLSVATERIKAEVEAYPEVIDLLEYAELLFAGKNGRSHQR